MSKIARSVNVENIEDYLTLGDLRALVEACEEIGDDASVSTDAGKIDVLQVDENPVPVGDDLA